MLTANGNAGRQAGSDEKPFDGSGNEDMHRAHVSPVQQRCGRKNLQAEQVELHRRRFARSNLGARGRPMRGTRSFTSHSFRS